MPPPHAQPPHAAATTDSTVNSTGETSRAQRLLFYAQAGALLVLGTLLLLALLAQHVQWPVLLMALTLLLLAEALLLCALRRLKHHLRERDAALRALLDARHRATREAAARARMLAFVTHELRTPLNGLLGMAALLRGTPLTPEQASYVHAMDTSGRLLASMVDELLHTARAEATGALDNEAPAAQQPFDPARLVEETCELLSPRAHARGLELACFIDPRIAGQWLGDEVRLRQILLNLLGNAVKFTQSGGVLVRLVAAQHGGRPGLRLSVQDTGPGVPQEIRARICQPFTRNAARDVAREGGVGLGLAIVQHLLQRMNGVLELDRQPGQGATFHAFLPLSPATDTANAADATDAADAADTPTLAGKPLAGLRVVLVVPGGMHRQALLDYIINLGGTALIAAPEELPQWLAETDVQVIVDAAHAEALRQLLAGAGLAPAARVWLFLTPEERLPLHELMHDKRLAGYLLKPLRRATIIERLSSAPERMLDASVHALRGLAQQARTETSSTGSPAAAQASADAPLVLLAEDDPVNARVAETVLRRAGYAVRRFADGSSLLQEVRARLLRRGGEERRHAMPVCALLDVHMPGMDGPQAAQAIRQLEHDLGAPRLLLIALTAADDQDERARCLAAGMDAFLCKPLDADELREVLRRCLRDSGVA